MTTAAQTDVTPLRRFLEERFPLHSKDGRIVKGDDDDEEIDCEEVVGSGESGEGGDDDDSSVAMDRFLRARMDAVFPEAAAAAASSRSASPASSPLPDVSVVSKKNLNKPSSQQQLGETAVTKNPCSPLVNGEGAEGEEEEEEEAHHPEQGEQSSSDSTTAASSSQTPRQADSNNNNMLPTTPTPIYNPFSNYSPSVRAAGAPRKEIMGMSIPIFAHSPSMLPQVTGVDADTDANATPKLLWATPLPSAAAGDSTTNNDDADDHDDDDSSSTGSSVDSDGALERWARQIRVELRHAEMAELAVEAERAAESGLETFAAKLSTYGGGGGAGGGANSTHDDSFLSTTTTTVGGKSNVAAFKKTDKSPLYQRRKSFSEGTKLLLRRVRSAPAVALRKTNTNRIGVMDLRDVEEVFPSFGQFHGNLRTHFARRHVDERTLSFKESKRSSSTTRWGSATSSPSTTSIISNNSHRQSPSDLFKKHKPRSPSDFFKHPRSPSDLFKHHRTPSDFFQNLFVKSVGSSWDTADDYEVADVLADHIHSQDDRLRKLPTVVIPEGLELPDLTAERPTESRRRRRSPQGYPASGTCFSDPGVPTPVMTPRTRKHQLSPKALFDRDDGLDSDGSRDANNNERLPLSPPPPPPPPHAESPEDQQKKPGPDFVTPARLRVIRNSTSQGLSNKVLEEAPPTTVECLFLMTPNSVVDSTKSETGARRVVELNRKSPAPALEDTASSAAILLPQKLGGGRRSSSDTSEIPKVNIGFKPRPSEPSDDDCCTASLDLDLLPPYEHDSRSTLPMRLSPAPSPGGSPRPTVVEEDHHNPQTPSPGKKDLDDSGIQATPEAAAAASDSIATGGESKETEKQKTSSRSRNRSVKVMIYGTCPPSLEGQSAMSGMGAGRSTSDGVLQHAQTISLVESDYAVDNPATVTAKTDCAFFDLTAPCSRESMCSSALLPGDDDWENKASAASSSKTNLMKRSASAGNLSYLVDSGRSTNWNPFAVKAQPDTSSSSNTNNVGSCKSNKPFQAAMDNIFSRISPRRKSKALYLPPKENDDFLHNYLYCSKPPEVANDSNSVCAKENCVDVTTDMCCHDSLFPGASFFGLCLTSSSRRTAGGPLLSLGGDAYARMEPETWFNLASDHFDGVLTHLAGRTHRDRSPWKVSFQAPTLRKSGDLPQQQQEQKNRERVYSIVDHREDAVYAASASNTAEIYFDDEKKSETTTEYGETDETSSAGSSSANSRHVRHLSYFPSTLGPQSALSDNKFQYIHGVTRQALAGSLHEVEAYQQQQGDGSVNNNSSNKAASKAASDNLPGEGLSGPAVSSWLSQQQQQGHRHHHNTHNKDKEGEVSVRSVASY